MPLRPPPSATAELLIPAAMPVKRKKWTEEEERSLIDKYAAMQSDGTLVRMRTREKKFRPIAAHVNAAHHATNPTAYPFLWSWKDASTKVQNMRHQYLLVKQKLLSAAADANAPLDWTDGLSLWPNFLRYKHVFGDAPLRTPEAPEADPGGHGFPSIGADDDGDLCLGLRFDCCGGEDVDEEEFDYEEVAAPSTLQPPPPPPPPQQQKKRKRPERRAWARLATELARLREREMRMEEPDAERERRRRERNRAEAEVEEREWERTRREAEEGVRRRREEEEQEQEWEERMERRRAEWREQMEGMLNQHRVEMENIHARILHDQQSIINQLLGVFSHWPSPGLGQGLSDGPGIGSGMGSHNHPYLAQMMQNLHHMNGMVPGENRVVEDGQEDQFIVNG